MWGLATYWGTGFYLVSKRSSLECKVNDSTMEHHLVTHYNILIIEISFKYPFQIFISWFQMSYCLPWLYSLKFSLVFQFGWLISHFTVFPSYTTIISKTWTKLWSSEPIQKIITIPTVHKHNTTHKCNITFAAYKHNTPNVHSLPCFLCMDFQNMFPVLSN